MGWLFTCRADQSRSTFGVFLLLFCTINVKDFIGLALAEEVNALHSNANKAIKWKDVEELEAFFNERNIAFHQLGNISEPNLYSTQPFMIDFSSSVDVAGIGHILEEYNITSFQEDIKQKALESLKTRCNQYGLSDSQRLEEEALCTSGGPNNSTLPLACPLLDPLTLTGVIIVGALLIAFVYECYKNQALSDEVEKAANVSKRLVVMLKERMDSIDSYTRIKEVEQAKEMASQLQVDIIEAAFNNHLASYILKDNKFIEYLRPILGDEDYKQIASTDNIKMLAANFKSSVTSCSESSIYGLYHIVTDNVNYPYYEILHGGEFSDNDNYFRRIQFPQHVAFKDGLLIPVHLSRCQLSTGGIYSCGTINTQDAMDPCSLSNPDMRCPVKEIALWPAFVKVDKLGEHYIIATHEKVMTVRTSNGTTTLMPTPGKIFGLAVPRTHEVTIGKTTIQGRHSVTYLDATTQPVDWKLFHISYARDNERRQWSTSFEDLLVEYDGIWLRFHRAREETIGYKLRQIGRAVDSFFRAVLAFSKALMAIYEFIVAYGLYILIGVGIILLMMLINSIPGGCKVLKFSICFPIRIIWMGIWFLVKLLFNSIKYVLGQRQKGTPVVIYSSLQKNQGE